MGGRLREEDARRLAVTMRCDLVFEAGARNRATPVSALHVERGRPSRTPVFEVEGHELGRAEQLVVAEAAVAGVSFRCRDDESVFAAVVADDAAEYAAFAGPLASWAHDEGGATRQPSDRYLAALAEPKRSTLAAVRRSILEVVPDAEQCTSYGGPAFKVQAKTVAGFAAFKNHLSYLPHSGSVLAALPDDVARYETSKGSLKFAVDKPLPKRLARKLVITRMRELGLA